MKLKDPKLFRTQAYIDGKWVDADKGETLTVDNPASGKTIGTVPKMGAAVAPPVTSEAAMAPAAAPRNVLRDKVMRLSYCTRVMRRVTTVGPSMNVEYLPSFQSPGKSSYRCSGSEAGR